jgi:hypothetical protein
MPHRHIGKAITNDSKYSYTITIAVADDELDLESSRRIANFHRLHKIEVRHGRTSIRKGQIYFRWRLPDLTTARAFVEQFGGKIARRSLLAIYTAINTAFDLPFELPG